MSIINSFNFRMCPDFFEMAVEIFGVSKWGPDMNPAIQSKIDFKNIPPPRMNMIRYHGVFAPNFKNRNKIVPKKESSTHKNSKEPQAENVVNKKIKVERLRWAEMLKKTFEIDVSICPKCNGRLEQIAVIKNIKVAAAILKSLNQCTRFKPKNPLTTGPPLQPGNDYDFNQRNEDW